MQRRAIGLCGLVWAMAWLATAAWAEPAGKVYGDGVTQKVAVPVATLLSAPDRYVGQTVRVDGVISAVCQSMGCWLEITDPALGRGIRFKVQDGVIVFPKDAAGRQASAQGVFEQIATSPVREAHHQDARAAESNGTPAPTLPTEKVYWVRASGAVIH